MCATSVILKYFWLNYKMRKTMNNVIVIIFLCLTVPSIEKSKQIFNFCFNLAFHLRLFIQVQEFS